MRRLTLALGVAFLLGGCKSASVEPTRSTPAAEPIASVPAPMYKPSSSSPKRIAINTDAYGAYRSAPKAPKLGDVVEDFELPTVDGSTFRLEDARKAGPVLVMFYRGYW